MKKLASWVATTVLTLGVFQAVALVRHQPLAPAPAAAAAEPSASPVAAPVPSPVRQSVRRNPDPRNPAGAVIEISIEHQRLTAWRDGRPVMRLVISTGRPGYETPTGHYKVIFKNRNAWSTKWGVWMPWAMNWHGNYFIHQLPHYPSSPVNIGASTLGKPASHGCVRVNVGDAESLFHWTKVGTPVWVH
ncbi:MAG: L,D-transpeptidase [Actinomycetota bacterium]|nr:L,D-transpeptidase [Actinomycetota bacterium]